MKATSIREHRLAPRQLLTATLAVFGAFCLSVTDGCFSDPCTGEDCGGHGTCTIAETSERCQCDEGYTNPVGDPLSCEAELDIGDGDGDATGDGDGDVVGDGDGDVVGDGDGDGDLIGDGDGDGDLIGDGDGDGDLIGDGDGDGDGSVDAGVVDSGSPDDAGAPEDAGVVDSGTPEDAGTPVTSCTESSVCADGYACDPFDGVCVAESTGTAVTSQSPLPAACDGLAVPLTSHQPYVGSVAAPNDVDCFTVSTTDYIAVMARLTELTSDLDLVFYNGADLLETSNSRGTGPERVDGTSDAAFDAVVVVQGYNGATGPYVLTVVAEADDPNSLENARLVPLGTLTGSIQSGTDVDYFKVALSEPEIPGALQVTLSDLTEDLDLYLFNDVNNEPLDLSNGNGTVNEQVQWQVNTSQNLYILVEGYMGALTDYTLLIEVISE